MRKFSAVTNSYSYVLVLLIISGLDLGTLKLDKRRINPRLAYEQQLHKMAVTYGGSSFHPFKDKMESDQPDMAALQEFFMTMDPALLRVPAERLPAAWSAMHKLQTKSTSYQLTWSGTSTEMGGRTRAIMWDPNDVNGKKGLGWRSHRWAMV